MNTDCLIRELAEERRDQEAEERRWLDERWDRLSAGTLSTEEEAELLALAETSMEAREIYEAFRPLGPDFQASVVQAIQRQSDPSIQAKIRRAVAGDEAEQIWLVRTLTPVIQSRVARMLLSRRRGPAAGRDIRQEVEDLAQEIFLVLFADGGKVLRSWQPERGLSFPNFAGLVAERQTASIFRGKRSPWKEDPTLPEDFDQPAPESGPEEITASREQLRLLLDRLKEELSPLGQHLFDLLYLRELPVDEVIRRTGMTADAVYAWRSRLRRLACRLIDSMSEDHGKRRISWRGGTYER